MKAVITSRGFFTFLGCVLLALLVWFAGPLIAIAGAVPLAGWITRLAVIVLIFALWGGVLGWRAWQAKKANQVLAGEIAASEPGDGDLLAEKMAEALVVLKSGRGGKDDSYLYQLPWYVLIGPPGAGKTTALVNSGLKFPAGEQAGPVAGVGGTRYCDWWFTDRAVLVDTAGRYTTQDSDAARDKDGWLGFLGVLKKHRPLQPLNGILIAVSVTDLIGPASELQAHATAIRLRIQEIYDRLGVVLPVYVMLTKLDLLAGFTQFFDDLAHDERAQVWGATAALPAGRDPRAALADIGREFGALTQTLNARVNHRIQQESDGELRAAIFGFPQQVAALAAPLQSFLADIFAENRFAKPALLRGVYMTSGTQDGTPLDRVLGALNARFGVAAASRKLSAPAGRSYFLTDLLSELVFAEAGLAGLDPRAERRRRMLYLSGVAAGAIVFAGLAAVWGAGYFDNRARLEAFATAADKIAALPANSAVANGDPVPELERLNALRALPYGPDAADAGGFALGLGQGGKMRDLVAAVYQSELNRRLLPHLVVRLENQIQQILSQPIPLYDALKTYLMIGNLGPMDANSARNWIEADWAAALAGPAYDPIRANLGVHLQALLSAPLTPPALDGATIDQARAAVRAMPLANRIYARILASDAARALPDWTVAAFGGPQAINLFQRPSGQPLGAGVAGIYSRNGYFKAFQPSLGAETASARSEQWVFGKDAPPPSLTELAQARGDVERLYAASFTAAWQALGNDVAIRPASDLRASAQLALLAAGPGSPLKAVLAAMAQATDLTLPQAAAGALGGLAQKAGALTGAPAAEDPRAQLEQQFLPLRAFVLGVPPAPPPASTPLDQALAALQALGNKLNTIAVLSQGGAPQDPAALTDAKVAALTLAQSADTMPAPASVWFKSFTVASNSGISGANRQQMGKAFGEQVGGACATALNGRFPLTRSGAADVALADFSRFFAPGGVFAQFFQQNLRNFVDVSAKPWKVLPDGAAAGIQPDTVRQFERARDIGDIFFPGGAAQPALSYQIELVGLDAGVDKASLTIDGQTLAVEAGGKGALFRWPDPQGAGGAKLDLGGDAPQTRTWDGQWALFRLLADSTVTPGRGPDEIMFAVAAGGKTARFRLRAASVVNPFSANILAGFRCPAAL